MVFWTGFMFVLLMWIHWQPLPWPLPNNLFDNPFPRFCKSVKHRAEHCVANRHCDPNVERKDLWGMYGCDGALDDGHKEIPPGELFSLQNTTMMRTLPYFSCGSFLFEGVGSLDSIQVGSRFPIQRCNTLWARVTVGNKIGLTKTVFWFFVDVCQTEFFKIFTYGD